MKTAKPSPRGRGLSRGALLLAGAGLVLGAIAWRAKAPTYSAPRVEEASAIPVVIEEALNGGAPEGYALRTFDVEGMCCQGCAAKLYGALLAVDGVRTAAVDRRAKQASALVRREVDPDALARALTFDKYTARAR